MAKQPSGPRCAVLVGPHGAGKTLLLESLLSVTGAVPRKGTIKEGTTVGDSSASSRLRLMSTELNVASTTFMDEAWTFIDCPGSIEFVYEAQTALTVADIAIVVCEPSIDRAPMLGPILKTLDDHAIPHIVFINKCDTHEASMAEVMAALQAVSQRPLVLREVPIRKAEHITGYVDLISERAYAYKPGQASDLIELPAEVMPRVQEARQELLEKLADFDDRLLEKLLEDVKPDKGEVFAHYARTIGEDKIVPVLFGSANTDAGVRRLLKSLRHDAPGAAATMERLGIDGGAEPLAQVFKTVYAAHSGKLSYVRIWRGPVADGATLGDGNKSVRVSGIGRPLGGQQTKVPRGEAGDTVTFGRMEGIVSGAALTPSGKSPKIDWPAPPAPLFALAIASEKRADDVKLSGALARIAEEDPSLSAHHEPDTGEYLLWGQGEMHLAVALDRLKAQFNLSMTTRRPQVPYKETIRKPLRQHARHKRQSGGHGQFADVTVEIAPQPRGAGYAFLDKIVGGVVPRNFIPAVDEGIQESLKRGPLGFQVVDMSVALVDGQYHSVDSSDMAFKTAGALAMREGLSKCDPVLLEPICKVTIAVPSDFTARAQRIVSGRRGQILGFDAKPGWQGWDEVQAYLPQAEMHDLIIELRSLTMGVGSFAWVFDHMAELTGRPAEKVIQAAAEARAAQ
jgi:elongation factor G